MIPAPEQKLLSCPFCHSNDIYTWDTLGNQRCGNCGAHGPDRGKTILEHIMAWNHRVGPEALAYATLRGRLEDREAMAKVLCNTINRSAQTFDICKSYWERGQREGSEHGFKGWCDDYRNWLERSDAFRAALLEGLP